MADGDGDDAPEHVEVLLALGVEEELHLALGDEKGLLVVGHHGLGQEGPQLLDSLHGCWKREKRLVGEGMAEDIAN